MQAPKAAKVRRRPSIHRVVLALIGTVGLLAALSCIPSQDASPEEQRSQQLNETIMCPVCPGESIDQSQNLLAAQMRDIVREKLAEGWTDEEIRDFFVERYGPSVLLEPPREGLNLVAWLLPLAVVIGAAAALFLALRAMTRGTRSGPEAGSGSDARDEDHSRYARLVQEAVDGAEGSHPAGRSHIDKSNQD